MRFEVTILGTNSAFPAHGRYPTAQVVTFGNNLYLVDCGEGTQMRLSEFQVKRSRIDHIFISHLHGDHVFGLPGLLNSYAHFSRNRPMHIHGPKGIRQLIDTVLRLSASIVDYEIEYHELEGGNKRKVVDEAGLRVYAFPLKHRIPTYGYLFEEKTSRINIRKDAIRQYDLSVPDIHKINNGVPYHNADGKLVPRTELMIERPPRKYGFCSDTIYDTSIVDYIKGVDLLYHEATFLHALEDKAVISKHTTAFQAGMIARLAEAERLLIGHFSSRYDDVAPLVKEAREAFEPTDAAEEGRVYQVGE